MRARLDSGFLRVTSIRALNLSAFCSPHASGSSQYRFVINLTSLDPLAYLECALVQFPAHSSMMFTQPNSSYRDYYYYGSLSTRRDGAAKDCQSMLSM